MGAHLIPELFPLWRAWTAPPWNRISKNWRWAVWPWKLLRSRTSSRRGGSLRAYLHHTEVKLGAYLLSLMKRNPSKNRGVRLWHWQILSSIASNVQVSPRVLGGHMWLGWTQIPFYKGICMWMLASKHSWRTKMRRLSFPVEKKWQISSLFMLLICCNRA